MHSVLLFMACGAFFGTAELARALPRGDEPVKVRFEWKGESDREADYDLWLKAPKDGVITGPKEWAILWKSWNSGKALPKVDFGKELLLVAAAPGPNTITIRPLKLNERGDLTFDWVATERGGPGFVYRILRVDRKGIQTVNGKKLP